jgi:hypothetical protein
VKVPFSVRFAIEMLRSTKENLNRVAAVFSVYGLFPRELVVKGYFSEWYMLYNEHILPSGDFVDVPHYIYGRDELSFEQDVLRLASIVCSKDADLVATSDTEIGRLFDDNNIKWINLNEGDFPCPDYKRVVECTHTNYVRCKTHLNKFCALKIAQHQFRWLKVVAQEATLTDCIERFKKLNLK